MEKTMETATLAPFKMASRKTGQCQDRVAVKKLKLKCHVVRIEFEILNSNPEPAVICHAAICGVIRGWRRIQGNKNMDVTKN